MKSIVAGINLNILENILQTITYSTIMFLKAQKPLFLRFAPGANYIVPRDNIL